MKTWLVGGAVRDKLLSLPVSDKDWVVTGSTPEQMMQSGFKAVGKDFPVFLHPETHEEYALARTERKTNAGYHGFQFHTAPDVTLEEDLIRRDLTINAMALDEATGQIVDPCGGQDDLAAKLLRHTSPAFAEDPVRILRIARFSARFQPMGFKIAPETLSLMKVMVKNGEVDALVPERVFQEFSSALKASAPEQFIETLRACGALVKLFPEIDALFGQPQPIEYHPEIDCGIHSLMTLKRASFHSPDPIIRFASLLHDLGKGITPKDKLPHHYGHEANGVPLVKALCERLKVPTKWQQLALISCEYHLHVHRAFELKAATILKLFNRTNAWRNPSGFQDFLTVCLADSQGRTGYENSEYPQQEYLQTCLEACQQISAQSFVQAGLKGEAISQAMNQARLEAIKKVYEHRSEFKTPES